MNDIEITYDGKKYAVKLDGEEIANKLMSIEIEPMTGLHPPSVEFGLRPGHLVLAGEAIVDIDKDTRGLLLQLGWTPPKGTNA